MKNLYGSKAVRFLLEAKRLWLMYFAGGTAVYLLICLLLRQNMLPAATLWQIMLYSLLCAALQQLLLPGEERPTVRRVALHCALTLALAFLLGCLFRWFPLNPVGILIFLGIFAAIYAGLFLGFSILYRVDKERLNESLAAYKQGRRDL